MSKIHSATNHHHHCLSSSLPPQPPRSLPLTAHSHIVRVCVLMSHDVYGTAEPGEPGRVGLDNNNFNHFSYPLHQERERERRKNQKNNSNLFLHGKTTYLSVSSLFFLLYFVLWRAGRKLFYSSIWSYFPFSNRSPARRRPNARTTVSRIHLFAYGITKTREEVVGESLPFCFFATVHIQKKNKQNTHTHASNLGHFCFSYTRWGWDNILQTTVLPFYLD